MFSSSTGNITGIYDLSGGASEYVAAFNNEDSNDHFTSYGNSFASTTKSSDEYATQYTNSGSATYAIATVYSTGKIGDATKEVRTNNNSRNWFGDTSYVLGSDYPFLRRGGGYSGTYGAGTFYSSNVIGYNYKYNSFRVVLAQ